MSGIYDVIIVGGGPAGLTAAVYTSREMLNTLLLEKDICGGLPASTDLIENYPGFSEGTNGKELVDRFKKQAERFGTKISEFSEVKKVEVSKEKIKVQTEKEVYFGYSLIVASGSIPKKVGVPGEEEFKGRGVSYCATCDGPLYRGKDVAVIGCGNSGLQEGEALLKYVKSITFVEFLPFMNAEKILQERLKKSEKTNFLLNHKLLSINGEGTVSSITVEDRTSGESKEIKVSGVFVYVGFLPNSKFLEGLVDTDKSGYIKTDDDMKTKTDGIYAVGDVRSKKVRQITVACGEATVAAISVREYLNKIKR
ncbi:MAG: thioredoxin-disulfide reductase [Candidatus Omnitrophota bacterium]|nr:MAG: thioredoxin-disulfide reductase [Candidatus Omnitrophota bacterium]RKY44242.1 MAG: thioredoxin-disulfide reductase [Candidatus Omnitrophota bacterium]HDN85829.1 FAD-dependent oxidoreductase [Candidatus Omnitrophota bacterium]